MVSYILEENTEVKLTKSQTIYCGFKRIVDILISMIGIIISIPIIIIFGIIIKIEDNGPVFYKQERLGEKNKHFYIYKLRSMKVDAEKIGGAQWAQENDDRITRIGKFIRKTRIDELPQLVNIIKGDMSLIGPRPERPELTYEFEKNIPGFSQRLVVKPGLTGWAQVNGGYDITPKEKFKLDIEYINSMGILIDTKIIVKTIYVILTGHGAR